MTIQTILVVEGVQRLLKTAGVAFFRLVQGFEPIRDLGETFLAGNARHVGGIARLTGDRRLKNVGGSAYRLARHRVTDLGEEVEMAVRMPGLALRRGAENGGDVVLAIDVRFLCKVEVAHVYFGGLGECLFQVLSCLRAN